MAKAAAGKQMTKSEVAAALSESVGKETGKEVSKKTIAVTLNHLAQLAYKQAKNTFVVPGLGKLVLVQRPAKKMIMPFGPDKGKEKLIPKKTVVKFRLAKAAKDAILGVKK